uniref:Uncharacterized protein n=1 Tax=Anopheles merus TaxID=30066 RepID=A0A182UU10_ANOME
MGPRRPAAGGPGNMFGGGIGGPQLGIPLAPPFMRFRMPGIPPFFMGRFIGGFIRRLPFAKGPFLIPPPSSPLEVAAPAAFGPPVPFGAAVIESSLKSTKPGSSPS